MKSNKKFIFLFLKMSYINTIRGNLLTILWLAYTILKHTVQEQIQEKNIKLIKMIHVQYDD